MNKIAKVVASLMIASALAACASTPEGQSRAEFIDTCKGASDVAARASAIMLTGVPNKTVWNQMYERELKAVVGTPKESYYYGAVATTLTIREDPLSSRNRVFVICRSGEYNPKSI